MYQFWKHMWESKKMNGHNGGFIGTQRIKTYCRVQCNDSKNKREYQGHNDKEGV